MRYIDRRIRVICNELKKLAVVQTVPISNWYMKKGKYINPTEAEASIEQWELFDSRTMHWYGPDCHYWFRTEYTVPESFDGKPFWITVRTNINHWDAINPQFLLFVDGEVTQGMDINHQEVLLTTCAEAGKTYHFDLQAYTGIHNVEFNLFADALEINPEIEGLYYDLVVPLDAFPRLGEDSKTRKDIETVLNNTINYLDLRTPYSPAFYESVKEARAYIAKALYEDMAGYDEVIATCIGHTHIDVAWWWTVDQTRQKVGRSFTTVLKLMEEYPNYRFMSSQPQLYAFLKERYPEVFVKIQERVKEGRWEPEGGMWLEADCNLTSGESLVRQFMHGKKFFKENFGVDNKILWLPDVFGYSGALPQIMKKSGIDYFMTTKLAWNQINKMPNDTMMWRGIDGTEVLTHLITTVDVGTDVKKSFYTTYNGRLHTDSIMGGWERYSNKDINNDILVCYGYGDGGGGPTREMLETSKRLETGIKGIPKVRQAGPLQYFEELEKRVVGNKRLNTWEGEFYFEYHRGTYTSMARNKKANRKSELTLMDLELFSVLAKEMNYPYADLDQMWKVVLLNQFHDILPGSSIHEVYEVTKEEYDAVLTKAQKLIAERLSTLVKAGDGITLYNTTGFNRNDIAEIPTVNGNALVDEVGVVYPIQKTDNGSIVYVKNLPSKGSKVFAITNTEEQACPFTLDGNNLETPFYKVSFDECGQISSIFDKENRRNVLQKGQVGNLLRMYEDKPIDYDNWDIEMYYTEKYWDVTDVQSMEWTEMGPVRATLEIKRNVSNSVIVQQIRFYAEDRKIQFDTWIDWKEHQHLLKAHFPVAVHTDEATFDIQFGNVKRKVHTNTSWDEARFESCAHKWMDISEGHYGVSLLNDCKYGHSVKDSNMALTLVKSGIVPNETTDQEEHVFSYAIYPHKEDWRAGGTVSKSYAMNQPIYAVCGGNVGEESSFVSCDATNVVIETVKKAEDGDGIIIRMYECENAWTPAHLTLGFNPSSVIECNLLEETVEEISVSENGFDIEIKPYEIKTYRIR